MLRIVTRASHISLLAVFSLPLPGTAQAAPPAGLAVLQQMHDAYAGKWYHTLTFVQRTIVKRATRTDTSTWYESLKGPALLRIDTGEPSAGNGVIYTADSVISVRNGAVVRRSAGGNEFLPLIMGVYLQPMAETVRQLELFGFDLSRTTRVTWEGRPAIMVGTTDPADSLSPQFWIDPERWVVLRARGTISGGPRVDITTGGYVMTGGGWLATHVQISTPTVMQTEDYRDWNTSRDLPDALFDPAQWRTAPHWATQSPHN